MCVLHIAIGKDSKGIQKDGLAIWISKVVIAFNLAKQVAVVFFHLSQVLTCIDTLPNRHHMGSCMSHNLSSVFASSVMIALGAKFNVPSSLPKLLVDALDMTVGLYIIEVLFKRV